MEEYLHCLVSPFQVANNQETNGFAVIQSFGLSLQYDGDYILAVRQLESTIFNTSLGLCAAVAGVIMMVLMVLILVEIISFGILTVNRWHQLTTNTEKTLLKSSFLPKLGEQKHLFNCMTYPWW